MLRSRRVAVHRNFGCTLLVSQLVVIPLGEKFVNVLPTAEICAPSRRAGESLYSPAVSHEYKHDGFVKAVLANYLGKSLQDLFSCPASLQYLLLWNPAFVGHLTACAWRWSPRISHLCAVCVHVCMYMHMYVYKGAVWPRAHSRQCCA